MASMNMKKRIQISHKLAKDLSKFNSCMVDKFMCPVCTVIYNVSDEKNITDAHIIPEAAGGKELTLLCKSCNGSFGSNQDKWFGEYLNILLDEEKPLFFAKTKSKYIELNGVRVRGDIVESDDGGINVYLPTNHNPPGKVELIEYGKSMELSFEIPLVKYQRQIEVGYLIAAYLLWFKQLGYSWVYQGHLNDVRKQIENPEDRIISGSFMVDIPNDAIIPPCAGVLDLGERSYPCAAIYDRIVVFPTISDPDIYSTILDNIREAKVGEFYSLNVTDSHNHVGPMGVIYKNSVLVFPDHFVSGKINSDKILFFPNAVDPPQWMRPMKKEEHQALVNNKEFDAKTIKAK